MGHKVHPKVFRLAVTRHWGGSWFSRKQFAPFLREDVRIRSFLMKELKDALVDRVEVERSRGTLSIAIFSGKPGVIIGRAGAGIEELGRKIKQTFFRGRKVDLHVNVKEVQRPSLSAAIVAQQIAQDLEKRMPCLRHALASTTSLVPFAVFNLFGHQHINGLFIFFKHFPTINPDLDPNRTKEGPRHAVGKIDVCTQIV